MTPSTVLRRPGVSMPVGRTFARRGTAPLQTADRHIVSSQGLSAPGDRSVPLGTSTQSFAVEASTGTAYVSSDDGTVWVVDVGHCNTRRASSCAGPVAELPGPVESIGVAVYRNTLYVTSGIGGTDGVVSVYDVLHCHAGDTSGCGAAVATVPLADIPTGVALDSATGTLFVGNTADHIDVLALPSCRRMHLSGCGSAVVGSIPATDGPVFPTLDAAHRTLYVPANGPGGDTSGDSVHVIDIRHCVAEDTSGCAAPEARLPADAGAVVAFADDETGTLYAGRGTRSAARPRRRPPCARMVGRSPSPTIPAPARSSPSSTPAKRLAC